MAGGRAQTRTRGSSGKVPTTRTTSKIDAQIAKLAFVNSSWVILGLKNVW